MVNSWPFPPHPPSKSVVLLLTSMRSEDFTPYKRNCKSHFGGRNFYFILQVYITT